MQFFVFITAYPDYLVVFYRHLKKGLLNSRIFIYLFSLQCLYHCFSVLQYTVVPMLTIASVSHRDCPLPYIDD